MNKGYTVFVCGSMKLKVLPPKLLQRLDSLICLGADFFVGDCWGIDTEVQRYLVKQKACFITCYIGASPRNHYGSKCLRIEAKGKSRRSYQVKDDYMNLHSDELLCVWDKKSQGTKHNIQLASNLAHKLTIY